jgi:hypothetical protein
MKQLRKNKSSVINERIIITNKNIFEYLEDIEGIEGIEGIDEIQTSKQNKCIVFNDLPEDTINNILEFLPYNTRLAILKHKYRKNYIKIMFQKVPKTFGGIAKLWKCAELANEFLKSLLEYNSDILRNLSTYCLHSFKCDAKPEKYSSYYIEYFSKIILTAIKHYTKIYKGVLCLPHCEQIVMNLFAHLSCMNYTVSSIL